LYRYAKENRAGLPDRGDTAEGGGFADGGEGSSLTHGGMLCGEGLYKL
jgi:hypothetical protein